MKIINIDLGETCLPDKVEIENKGRTDPLEELEQFGSSLIKQSLPPNTQIQVHFKVPEKLSMNQMKQQQQLHQTNTVATASPTPTPSVPSLPAPAVAATGVNTASLPGKGIDALLNLDLLSGGDLSCNTTTSTTTVAATATTNNTVDTAASLLDDRPFLDGPTENIMGSLLASMKSEVKNNMSIGETKPKVGENRRKSSTSNPQFMEVKPMTDLKVTLDSIKPGKNPSS